MIQHPACKLGTATVLSVAVLLLLSLLFVPVPWTAAAEGFPRTVEDGLGREITLEEPPQRIFSAGLAMDNILLYVTDPQRVVGVTRYAADPEYSYVADRLQDHMVQVDQLDPELVLAAEPDIVLVAHWSDQDAVQQLRDLGVPVYTFTAFAGVEDAMENILRIGEITGDEEQAEALVAGFYEAYGRLAARLAGRDPVQVLSWSSWGTTTGSGTSTHDVIEMAGGTNLAAARGIEGWREIDAEIILDINPEVIVTSSGEDFVAQIQEDPVLQEIEAVREGRVYHIDDMEALNHYFIRAVRELAELLHPEVFAD